MKCIVCGKEFESERMSARFCSDTCRQKHHRLSVTGEPVSVTEVSVTSIPPVDKGHLSVTEGGEMPKDYIDIVKDLHLDLTKDLGIIGWTKDGIFIRPDITIKQVQTIARLVAARHGRVPEFRECL